MKVARYEPLIIMSKLLEFASLIVEVKHSFETFDFGGNLGKLVTTNGSLIMDDICYLLVKFLKSYWELFI
jgi:hypothetical protein